MKNATFDQRTAARATLEVAWLIDRNKKPHTTGEELIESPAEKMVEIMCGPKYSKRLNSVLVKNNETISAKIMKHQISNLARNVREQMISSIKSSVHFASQLDEITDLSNDSQLMVYVRYRGMDRIEEEMLFGTPHVLHTRGIDVFQKVNAFFKSEKVNLQ